MDRQQQRREQNTTGLVLIAAVALQIGLSLTWADMLAIVLPAIGLSVVTAVLTLRSSQSLSLLQPKRTFLAAVSLVFATLFALTLLVDDPKSAVMMQLARLLFIDCAFLGVGRLSASLIAGYRSAPG